MSRNPLKQPNNLNGNSMIFFSIINGQLIKRHIFASMIFEIDLKSSNEHRKLKKKNYLANSFNKFRWRWWMASLAITSSLKFTFRLRTRTDCLDKWENVLGWPLYSKPSKKPYKCRSNPTPWIWYLVVLSTCFAHFTIEKSSQMRMWMGKWNGNVNQGKTIKYMNKSITIWCRTTKQSS